MDLGTGIGWAVVFDALVVAFLAISVAYMEFLNACKSAVLE